MYNQLNSYNIMKDNHCDFASHSILSKILLACFVVLRCWLHGTTRQNPQSSTQQSSNDGRITKTYIAYSTWKRWSERPATRILGSLSSSTSFSLLYFAASSVVRLAMPPSARRVRAGVLSRRLRSYAYRQSIIGLLS